MDSKQMKFWKIYISLFIFCCSLFIRPSQGERNETELVGQWNRLPLKKLSILKVIVAAEFSIYAAVIDKERGSLLIHSTNQGETWDEIPTAGNNLGMAITNNREEICGIGTKIYCIKLKEKTFDGSQINYEMSEMQITASPKEIHPVGLNGIAVIGLFTIPRTTIVVNGVALKLSSTVTDWQFFNIEGNAVGGSFPSENTWFIISGSWPIQNPDVSSMLSGRLNIIADRISSYHYEFLSLHDIPKDKYDGTISRTTDGGKTWKKVFDSNYRFYFNQIHCYNENSCLAVGEGSLSSYVLRTDDGGDTWEVVFRLQGQYSLHTCKMLSTKVMWVAGGLKVDSDDINQNHISEEEEGDDTYIGVYYYSDDGGGTWSMMTFDGYVYDLNFMNEEVGYAATIHRDHCEITKFQKH